LRSVVAGVPRSSGDTAHLEIERDEGSSSDILQDRKQFLAKLGLIDIHFDIVGWCAIGCLEEERKE
jgi:hypothetical protein